MNPAGLYICIWSGSVLVLLPPGVRARTQTLPELLFVWALPPAHLNFPHSFLHVLILLYTLKGIENQSRFIPFITGVFFIVDFFIPPLITLTP